MPSTNPMSPPTAGYKFNSFQEIKSHSSILFNERLAILFFMLDMRSIELNKFYDINDMLETKAICMQIYKNVRTLIRNNPVMRATLNLETKEEGIYVTDIAFGVIDKMVQYCENNGYTIKRIYIITQELNRIETVVKDILQYYHYFIRPDFRQKPDIEMATEKYKEIADKRTVEELKSIVGRNNAIDFENLGTRRIELSPELEEEEDEDDDKPGKEEDDGLDEDDYKDYDKSQLK